ncbi:MAG: chromosome segregation protein SMC [Candidatus Accumulibacter sp.]|jgi:chromosome segregation protein|nr:chromosome segregation protein SMC [Accumulibacter sp.]
MRLIKLKLAGFKSFVDLTSIALPGQLVGVVGPNGCGKSNVIDAVRWVLGESKASELRGESMQDVIFNGSGARKPVSRASVELVFDNSLGRISSQWSNYDELSVKRLLTRSGQSEYYINNLHVRRKDITDLFLGTGLGPRAYAIIGQGTISRIIEAHPQELRVFLEEAAGVTKYKERRKETERRLSDTHENLKRVEDIRLELGDRMEQLEEQARIARQYRDFSEELKRKQQLLWLLRRNEARAESERVSREIDEANLALEKQNAELRGVEARLVEVRARHDAASDALDAAQSSFYHSSSEVSRLESEIRHSKESHKEYTSRLAQLSDDKIQWENDVTELDEKRLHWEALLSQAEERVGESEARLAARRERLLQAEGARADALKTLTEERAVVAEAKERLRVESANRAHVERSIEILEGRRQKLERERAELPVPDAEGFEERRKTLVELREKISALQGELARLEAGLPEAERASRDAQGALTQIQKEQTEAHARRVALDHLQKRAQDRGQMDAWLGRHRLKLREPLWKSLHVEAPWDDAVEAVLRERLGAFALDDADPAWSRDRPGKKQTFVLSDAEGLAPAHSGAHEKSLLAKVRCDDAVFFSAVALWLTDALVASDLADALRRREELRGAAFFVTPAGDIVDRCGLTLFAPEASGHGVLERQREIEELDRTIARCEERIDEGKARLAEAEARREEAKKAVREARGALDELQEAAHAREVEALKLSQAMERFAERQSRIDAALAEIAVEDAAENGRLEQTDEAIETEREAVSRLQQALDAEQARFDGIDQALREERERVGVSERELQEMQFSCRECRGKIGEVGEKRELAIKQIHRIVEEAAHCSKSLEALRTEDLEPLLQEAVAQRVEREQSLAAARDALESERQSWHDLDEERIKADQGIAPLADRIGELRLKEQAATLSAEQLSAQLVEGGANEQALVEDLPKARAETLQRALVSLQRSIDSLGPVNMAALDELEAARERKSFLDAQSADLTQAMETLEDAIQKIDKETRGLLQSTFDTVNANFDALFPELFGGGEARLIMTGEEILDAGVQVMAQPPGKKNSTIHLLSGGEKALTAIALVFALFQLNPAPFCLLDEVDAPLDDTNTERFCEMVRRMSEKTQFLFISHNKIAMQMAQQLIGVTMQESGVSRIVEVDMDEALRMREQIV